MLLFCGDLALALAATKLAQWLRLGTEHNIFEQETGATIFSISIQLSLLFITDLYNLERFTNCRQLAGRIALALGSAAMFTSGLFYSLPQWQFGRGIFLLQTGIFALCIFTWRCCSGRVLGRESFRKKIIVIGAYGSGQEFVDLLQNSQSPYIVAGHFNSELTIAPDQSVSPTNGDLDGKEILQFALDHKISTAVCAFPGNKEKGRHNFHDNLLLLRLNGIEIFSAERFHEDLTGRLPVTRINPEWLLFTDGFTFLSKEYLKKVKRFSDFWLSLVLMLLTLPFLPVVALLIKLDSPGPLLYRQKRVGLNGKVFNIMKFRSMQHNTEAGKAVWAAEDDPRTTRIGRLLRLLRIDELPQLVNVIRGEMSLIGPRPERPEFTAELDKLIPYYGLRHVISPGITGWAQINYHYGASPEDALRKLEYDLYYIKNMTFWLDMRILFKTISVILFAEGAR